MGNGSLRIKNDTNDHYDVIVIGAGFAGAVFAREMADSGKRVLILEKRAQVCGNMYDEYVDGILVHKYGPHIFHTNNKKVFSYLKRFSSWYKYEHKVLGKVDEKYIPIPFNFTSIDMLFDPITASKFKTTLKEVFGKNRKVSVFDLLNHEEESIKELGQFIYEKIFVNYTAKQWGIPIGKIDVATINRVPVIIGHDDRYFSDAIQMMPMDGYACLFKKLLTHKNIEIQLNTNAKSKIHFDFDRAKIFFEGNEFEGIVFFTGAIDEFFDFKYGMLSYRSLNLVFEKINCKTYQPASVVNYPNDEYFTRITEFKHFVGLPNNDKNDYTTILKEYPLSYDYQSLMEPYYPVNNETNTEIYRSYADSLKSFQNLYLCGRLAEYKYYNMDVVIEKALFYAEKIKAKEIKTDKHILFKEVFLYGIIGSCSAGLDSAIFLLLRKIDLYLYLSNFISINCGILMSFLLNAFVNFKTTDRLLRRAGKFFSIGYSGLLISMLIMFVGVELLNGKELFTKIVSVFIVAAFQFTLNKLFTFKKEKNG